MSKLVGIAVVSVWLTSVVALVLHDMLPRWQAQEPPVVKPVEQDLQVGIFDQANRRMGTAWTSSLPASEILTVRSTTVLEAVPRLMPVRIESMMTYLAGQLDEIRVDVYGTGMTISLRGENMGAGFPCQLTVGAIRKAFAFDNQAMRALGEALRPFETLPDLHVGQSWRVKLFNPLKQVLGKQAGFESLLVRVTGMETIEHRGQKVECFRVEAGKVVAYADQNGRVLEQRVQLPLVGMLVLRDEPFDSAKRELARRRITPASSEMERGR